MDATKPTTIYILWHVFSGVDSRNEYELLAAGEDPVVLDQAARAAIEHVQDDVDFDIRISKRAMVEDLSRYSPSRDVLVIEEIQLNDTAGLADYFRNLY